MPVYCVLDIETTGLPSLDETGEYYDPSLRLYYSTSRIVSLAWSVYSNSEVIRSRYAIARADDVVIDDSSKACKINGLTSDKVSQFEVPLQETMLDLAKDLKKCDFLLAHNVGFDYNVLLSEAIGLQCTDLESSMKSIKKTCSKKEGKKYLSMQGLEVRHAPSLKRLYSFLFNEEVPNHHHAMADVQACARCYCKMVGWS